MRTFRMPWNGSFSDAPGVRVYRLVLVHRSTGFFANAFTRRHPSETLNENAKHDHCMHLEGSSILHSSFLPQISKSLKPTQWRSEGGAGGTIVPGRRVEGAPK